MKAANPIAQMKSLLAIRKAVAMNDRFELAVRNSVLVETMTLEARKGAVRDDALAYWHTGLNSPGFDPSIVRFAGSWLLDSEKSLGAAKLDTSIAEARRDDAEIGLVKSQASEAAAQKIYHRVRKTLEKKREERQSADLADMFLRSWNR